MPETPEASVLLVVRNAAATLPACLAHIEQQSLPPAGFEIVAADASSTDDTTEVLARHAEGAPVRMRLVHGPGEDWARAANAGLQAAQGRFVALLDCELLARPEWLAGHLAAQDGAGGMACSIGAVHRHPQMTRHAFARSAAPSGPAGPPGFWACGAANLCVPRAAALAQGGFDARFVDADCAAAELAYRLERAGLTPLRAPGAAAYWWRPARLEDERARAYRFGYAAQLLAECTERGPVRAYYGLRKGRLRDALDRALMPLYLRALPDDANDMRVWSGLWERILAHDRQRGYRDAQRRRAPAPPKG